MRILIDTNVLISAALNANSIPFQQTLKYHFHFPFRKSDPLTSFAHQMRHALRTGLLDAEIPLRLPNNHRGFVTESPN